MAFWSWCRVDWRQKLKSSIHLQLTTAGQNAAHHCWNALSLTAQKLHFASFLLPKERKGKESYTWAWHHLHIGKGRNLGQGMDWNITEGGMIHLKNKSLCMWRNITRLLSELCGRPSPEIAEILQKLCRFILTAQWNHEGLDGEEKTTGAWKEFTLLFWAV